MLAANLARQGSPMAPFALCSHRSTHNLPAAQFATIDVSRFVKLKVTRDASLITGERFDWPPYLHAAVSRGAEPDHMEDLVCRSPKLARVGLIRRHPWPTEGYVFKESTGLYDENPFLGLGLDEDNEPELTEERVHDWLMQVVAELGFNVAEAE